MNRRWRAVLVAALAGIVVAIWSAPRSLAGAGDDAAVFRFRGADGRPHAMLGDVDSYLWLRLARNYLATGTVCEDTTAGACRDRHANAPVGVEMKYARSLHVTAIVALHRVLARLMPGWPLEASAFYVPVAVAALAVLPTFALGRRLAGDIGGALAVVFVWTNTSLLGRALGSDDDVWNAALPIALAWAVAAALGARAWGERIGFATLGGAVVGLHAAVWNGWPITWFLALAATAAIAMVRALRGRTAAARAAIVVGAVLWLASGVGAWAAGAGASYPSLPVRLFAELRPPVPAPAAPATAHWPDVFATVAELVRPWRDTIAAELGGPAWFLVGWLGMLLCLLPRHGWEGPDFAVLIGGTLVYRYLVTAADVGTGTLLAVLILPLLTAVAVGVARRDAADDDAEGGALLVALWLLAALHLAHGAARFVFLLAAPFGLATAVAVGRVYGWASEAVESWSWRRPVRLVLLLLVALVAAIPVRHGWATARAYLPRIDAAWRDAFLRLHDQAPPDAIVFTWWDYGYWAEYFADRRVPADGASLRTHVPYWTARALATADARESVGLLRMLACGSDTTPEPEGRTGAVGRLVGLGIDELEAHDLVVALARDDRAAAAARLDRRGLAPADRDAVLSATHCAPPPSYLVLGSEQLDHPGWALLGTWDVRRGARPEEQVSVSDWLPCTRRGEDLECPGFVHRGLDPAHDGFVREGATPTAPSAVLLAGPAGAEQVAAGAKSGPAVLVDAAGARVAFGPAALLRSTFVRLALLDGRGLAAFEPIETRTGAGDRRVSVWRIRWPSD